MRRYSDESFNIFFATLLGGREVVGSEIPSLPVELMRHESRLREKDPRQRRPCFLVPAPHEIAVANDKWQVFRNYPAEYQAYLHGAHYDDRDRKRPMVRILALIDRCKKISFVS